MPGPRRGRRPDPGQEPHGAFPVAPRAHLPSDDLDAQVPGLVGGPELRPPGIVATFSRYRATIECREAELEALEADLGAYFDVEPFASAVARLAAYRGVERLGGLVLQAEVCDWRRFSGQDDIGAFCGLVPSEYSSGAKVTGARSPAPVTCTCAASSSRPPGLTASGPSLGAALRRRQEGVPAETVARAWAAQVDLCRRFRQLDARKPVRGVVVAAVARRLAGHLYAEMAA